MRTEARRAVCFTSLKLGHSEFSTVSKEPKESLDKVGFVRAVDKDYGAKDQRTVFGTKPHLRMSPELLKRRKLPRILCEAARSFDALSLRNAKKVAFHSIW
eukprot:TRINITY_DN5864_c0_g4_i1.p1 TRINITY_DN5864_c0_g4~~TRINITY_DN5864_c0_g4_i1.p1  ORF type:complete len:101 (-),score=7.08 TRINITY_DN5864_c0_g4_i1:721-1023(-)